MHICNCFQTHISLCICKYTGCPRIPNEIFQNLLFSETTCICIYVCKYICICVSTHMRTGSSVSVEVSAAACRETRIQMSTLQRSSSSLYTNTNTKIQIQIQNTNAKILMCAGRLFTLYRFYSSFLSPTIVSLDLSYNHD